MRLPTRQVLGALAVGPIAVSCVSVTEDNKCGSGAACAGKALELYYKETVGVEPWGAAEDGSMPVGWRESATSELQGVGLTPISVETVKVDGPPLVYALQIRVPDEQRGLALGRCFVADAHDSSPAAAKRTDCAPIYSAKK